MSFCSWLFGKPELSRPTVSLPGSGAYPFEVMGESRYQGALERICRNKIDGGYEDIVTAVLVHEDGNPYDGQAIRVDIDGNTVGYLGRAEARIFRKGMMEIGRPKFNAACPAMIRGGWKKGKKDRGRFGVRLDLPTSSKEWGPPCRAGRPNQNGRG